MEKLLRSKGINLVADQHEDERATYYAYNQDLLDKNLLIEFYNYEVDPDPENYEIETAVFVLTIDRGCSYNLSMYYEIGLSETAPMLLFRIITDIVDFVKICDKNSIIQDLSAISRSVSSSKEWTNEKDRKLAYANDLEKFNGVIELIELKKRSLN